VATGKCVILDSEQKVTWTLGPIDCFASVKCVAKTQSDVDCSLFNDSTSNLASTATWVGDVSPHRLSYDYVSEVAFPDDEVKTQ
jgi:hypothetical protein